MEYTAEQLEQKYNALPTSVKEAITSAKVEERVMAIGRYHKLHLDILGELADETGLVMLGLTHPRDYIRNLAERLGVSREEATAIARDVNEQIFRPIREALKQVHGLGGGAPAAEERALEIGGFAPASHLGADGDIASLEERRERLIRGGSNASAAASTASGAPIHERTLSAPVRTPRERIDLSAPARHDPYREAVEEADVRR